MRRRWRLAIALVALAVTLGAGRTVGAAEQVGTAAEIEGRAEVQHAGEGEWAPLSKGDGVLLGDRLRTGTDGKLRIVMREDSELTLGPSSQIEVTEQVTGAATVSRFQLLVGALRAVVTERYAAPRSRFEVETPTAIAGVRGTSFIADYDATKEETLIVGVLDVTRVRAATDPEGTAEVLLGPGIATWVRRGSRPVAPAPLAEGRLQGLRRATSIAASTAGARRGANALDARSPQRGGERAISPEGQAVDQPIFKPRGGKPGPPPPPVP
ncbi:MAG TPA: FecR family protein [Candidatus Eisenbacteria bacterium]|nr:FecR family protein [Candidatus Eisenbacteria bacterium]